MPDEHDTVVVADHAVAAVRDGTDLGLEALADVGGTPRSALAPLPTGGARSGHWGSWLRGRGTWLPVDSTRPRRRSPALTRARSRSSRARAICDDCSW